MPKFLLTNKQSKFECSFTYTEEGFLVAFELLSRFETPAAHEKFLQFDFGKLERLKRFSTQFKFDLKPVPQDLSFEIYWEAYSHKVGKKERAKKLWEALPEKDKIMCLQSIPRYKSWLAFRNIEMLYPETYLSQRRFENQYK